MRSMTEGACPRATSLVEAPLHRFAAPLPRCAREEFGGD